ncbi:MAG: hypothetical protein WCS87_11770 [Methylococcaceae bacterium]
MTWIVLPPFPQAEAQATALSEVMEVNLKTLLVTKEDLMHEWNCFAATCVTWSSA